MSGKSLYQGSNFDKALFAVALSENGKRFLNNQESSAAEPVSVKDRGLTEKVPKRSAETGEHS